jgi:hypothetical protein
MRQHCCPQGQKTKNLNNTDNPNSRRNKLPVSAGYGLNTYRPGRLQWQRQRITSSRCPRKIFNPCFASGSVARLRSMRRKRSGHVCIGTAHSSSLCFESQSRIYSRRISNLSITWERQQDCVKPTRAHWTSKMPTLRGRVFGDGDSRFACQAGRP